MNQDDEPDWDSFETYKGPDDTPRTPRWLSLAFHYFVILLCLGIAFCIGGVLFYFFSFNPRTAEHITMNLAQQKFIAGGIFGVILVIYWRFRKLP